MSFLHPTTRNRPPNLLPVSCVSICFPSLAWKMLQCIHGATVLQRAPGTFGKVQNHWSSPRPKQQNLVSCSFCKGRRRRTLIFWKLVSEQYCKQNWVKWCIAWSICLSDIPWQAYLKNSKQHPDTALTHETHHGPGFPPFQITFSVLQSRLRSLRAHHAILLLCHVCECVSPCQAPIWTKSREPRVRMGTVEPLFFCKSFCCH